MREDGWRREKDGRLLERERMRGKGWRERNVGKGTEGEAMINN